MIKSRRDKLQFYFVLFALVNCSNQRKSKLSNQAQVTLHTGVFLAVSRCTLGGGGQGDGILYQVMWIPPSPKVLAQSPSCVLDQRNFMREKPTSKSRRSSVPDLIGKIMRRLLLTRSQVAVSCALGLVTGVWFFQPLVKEHFEEAKKAAAPVSQDKSTGS